MGLLSGLLPLVGVPLLAVPLEGVWSDDRCGCRCVCRAGASVDVCVCVCRLGGDWTSVDVCVCVFVCTDKCGVE